MSVLRRDFLAFNPRRVYTYGDKIIAYDSCSSNIVLLQNINPGRRDRYNPQDWAEIDKEATGMDLCRGYRADYLGTCVKNIVLRNINLSEILYRPDLILLDTEPQIYFDNTTFI
jgi:hypothetical protein